METIVPEPGSVWILQRKDHVVFEAKSRDEPNAEAAGNFRRGPGSCEVDELPNWAKVSTGASTILNTRHMAFVVEELLIPRLHRLLGRIEIVMRMVGRGIAEVTVRKQKSGDEFVVVDGLYRHVLIGLKFLFKNHC